MKHLVAVISLSVISTSSVSAEEFDCSNAISNQEIGYCQNLEYQTEDKRLNVAFQKLKLLAHQQYSEPPVKPNEKTRMEQSLVKAQIEWVKYRDLNCQYYFDTIYPGREAAISMLACKIRMTKERADELDKEADFWGSR